jgi:hypothetical protein
MALSDYFGRFWFAAEPIFGVVMTLCFLGILSNPALNDYPIIADKLAVMVIGAALSCCIAWGIVDGIFYAWENHAVAARKNLTMTYAKGKEQRNESLKMVEEDLEDTYVDLLNEDEKKSIYDKVVTSLAKAESKEKTSYKDDAITIFLDFCLNAGACLVIILPLILLRNVSTLGLDVLVHVGMIIAILLLFFIGMWTETRKGLKIKVRKGIMYAILGVIITILTWILGG